MVGQLFSDTVVRSYSEKICCLKVLKIVCVYAYTYIQLCQSQKAINKLSVEVMALCVLGNGYTESVKVKAV